MRNITEKQNAKATELRDTEEQVAPVLIVSRGASTHFVFQNGKTLWVDHSGDVIQNTNETVSVESIRDRALDN